MKKLIVYENNCMSLSCEGSVIMDDKNIITEIHFKGYPRSRGDEWTRFFMNAKIGNIISDDIIDDILGFNGKNNVKAYLEDMT
jgi:hypothetical protein